MPIITSLQHPLVKHLVKLRTDSSYRSECHTLILEGVKPVEEVTHQIEKLFYTAPYAEVASTLPGEKWEVTEAIIQKASGMASPEGIIAEVKMPPFQSLSHQSLVLALDGISDPGNMGTLLRTALALGWEAAYLLPGCCDPFNEKALRAGRGAQFKLSLSKGNPDELERWVVKEDISSYVADIRGDPPEEIPDTKRRLLVMGNEARGPSAAIKQFCTPITIPMPGEMESLNVAVAGGILLYFLRGHP